MPLDLKNEPPYYTIDESLPTPPGGLPVGTKIYTAALNQTGTNDPTAAVMQNTLTGNIAWSRNATGSYIGTLTGEFTENKTTIIIGTLQTVNKPVIIAIWNNVNSIAILTTINETPADDTLIDTTIEIKIYP